MKARLIFCSLLLSSISAFSQGPVAHWDMNGTANDVSGNGHHGHSLNITPATGSDGIMGHGYYFNGINSRITVPYSSAFNTTKYTICATLNVMGFYNGTCQHNVVLTRGKTGSGTGNYVLYFGDHPVDLDCSSFDSTVDVFLTHAEARPVAGTAFVYTPYVRTNLWYKVVVTFNDTAFKTYVNDTLKNTTYLITPGVPLGATTDSISIGYNVFESGFPYPFKGVLDDIKLYNRVLSDSEISAYGDSCGIVVLQPLSVHTSTGSTRKFISRSTISGATCQWQVDAGTGFTNLSNAGPYSGVGTDTLVISGITSSLFGNHYRCYYYNSLGCTDTSSFALLASNVGVNEMLNEQAISIYPNPANNDVTIELEYNNEIGLIQVINTVGQIIREQKITSDISHININSLSQGIYLLKIELGGETLYRKLIKK